jgi:dTDP-4-amino-4,6-dideoxygalactose transaminase
VSSSEQTIARPAASSDLRGASSWIHLSKADVTAVEEAYVLDAIRSGWVAPLGPHVDAFEAEIATRVGVAAAVALSSGTAALHLGLLGLGARPGTVVLCPTLTFAASANAIVYTGAAPVFVDVLAHDGNVDPELMLDAVDVLRREGVTVTAAVVVDLFGRCANYQVLVEGLAARDVPLLEDAAESLGASFRGRQAGSFGQAAVLSFNGNKIMTTSGGGMLLSRDARLVEQARYLSTQARQPCPWYEHTDIGYNYRLSNILAALGRGQLSRLDQMIARRRAIRRQYVQALADVPGVRVLGEPADRGVQQDNCWLTCLEVDPVVAGTTAAALIARLAAESVEARHLWKPMHLQPVFADRRSFLTGRAEHLFANGLALPSGSSMTDAELGRVIDIVVGALRR